MGIGMKSMADLRQIQTWKAYICLFTASVIMKMGTEESQHGL